MSHSDLKLPDSLRKDLKKPLGRLIEDIKELHVDEKDIVICVGDHTSDITLNSNIKPKIIIFDGKVMRRKIKIPESIKNFSANEIRIPNPAGHITEESLDAISYAINSESRFKIRVDGEEDLLTLAVIKFAPPNSIILYGQPNEGVVVIRVDDKIKIKTKKFMELMKNEN